MQDKKFIFIAGLHRSGTSLLDKIIKSHPKISGFHNTGVPEDEGQHLQSVYEPAKAFGGPGKFAFHPESYMNETHPLATEENAKKLFKEWSSYLDISQEYIVEKSPPNIIRTRFLQNLFPNSKFIIILRHPIAVSFATKRWSDGSTTELIEHYLKAYEILTEDLQYLKNWHIIKYEDFISSPQKTIDEIFNYLELEFISINQKIKKDINKKYFLQWKEEKKNISKEELNFFYDKYEGRVNKFGYSLKNN